ncbi:Uncharacterised protein [Mycobacteroides abscessus subsp. abscessus]|nr:Uncharacterised protein [Mycobacteroides abscessus subsp. abscessus]
MNAHPGSRVIIEATSPHTMAITCSTTKMPLPRAENRSPELKCSRVCRAGVPGIITSNVGTSMISRVSPNQRPTMWHRMPITSAPTKVATWSIAPRSIRTSRTTLPAIATRPEPSASRVGELNMTAHPNTAPKLATTRSVHNQKGSSSTGGGAVGSNPAIEATIQAPMPMDNITSAA